MKINSSNDTFENHAFYDIRQCPSSGPTRITTDVVQKESLLEVRVNGLLTMRITCSATDLAQLVVGRLFTEGMISGAEEVDSIEISERDMLAEVKLRGREAGHEPVGAELIPTYGTGNRTLNAYFKKHEDLHPVEPIPWNPSWIFEIARRFKEDSPSHKRTFGTHSCYLASKNALLYCCEDLGRHNAFDKAIGSALMNGVELSRCLAFTSGRIPTDMVTKAIRARIPILASKAVVTDKTIELAKEYKLTLICSAHPDSMKVFNDPGEFSAAELDHID